MDTLDKKILEFINKAGRRMKLNFLIGKILVGLQASLILTLIILIISLFIPFKSCYDLSGLTIIIFLIISIIIGIIKAPKRKEIALIADSKGLNERVITSLEFIGDESERAKAQKEDTVRNIASYNFKKNLPVRIDKREIYKIIILLVLCFVIIIIPTTAKKEAQNLRNFDAMKSEISKNIEKEEKKIEKEDDLSKEEKEALKKVLEESKKELKEAKKKEDADKVMNRLEKKFDTLKEKMDSKDKKQQVDDLKKDLIEKQKTEQAQEALKNLNEINNSLSKSKLGKEILESLKNGDKEALENKLKSLNDSLKNLSDKEKSELSNSLKEAAANLSDEELKDLLEKASDNMMDGEIDPSELANALTSLKASSNSESNSGNNSDKSSEGTSSSGSGNGNGSGSGTGNGSGNGSGSGSGGNGGGWNTGSKNGNEKYSNPSSGEQVFIPGREVGNDENLKGNKNNSGTSQSIETQNGLNFNGEKKDYNSVIGDYSKEEIDSMNNSSLPENLQGVVKDYFNNIK